ncbi:MAG TPA: helix-turn-helix domain-containing protein [Opitutaceae bacterium]|nr:helix-turn-helix domain-containing protein [Opitutaceae bacterium]
MMTDKIKELEATQAKVASLVKAIETERNKEFRALPAKYGFPTVAAFLKAVKAAGGERTKASGGGKKRRTRAVITDDTRAQVKKLAAAGKTGAEIAATVGISLPSVQNVKKALGLVKAR